MTTRREQAAATRGRIIDAAHELFASVGYAGTTMKAIADRAGVAVQTVYFVFHTKAELLGATAEDVAAGARSPEPVADRRWFQEALETPDPHRAVWLTVDNGVDIYSRSARLASAIREAAMNDAAVRELWDGIQGRRKGGMRLIVSHLDELGALRGGLDVDRGTDIMHALASHDTYLELVLRAGWDVDAFKTWLTECVSRELLVPETRPPAA